MIVGRAISELIDKPENKMVFGGEEMDNIEARWYLSLTKANDRIGHLRDLKKHPSSASKPQPVKIEPASQAKPNEHKKETKVISIEEVVDDGNDSEDDEFVPYEKPDSDEEDEEEDATLVSREKATAPVYVRDLINGLRDADNYERQRLALSGAASLIRRKANFGMELTEHAEELATILTGLHDKYDMENFQEHRLQAMIALLVAQPLEMGQWYSKTFFDGDYSIGQRTSVLNALGMGARELAGYAAEDGALTGATTLLQGPAGSFPSKKLPPRLHALFADNQPTGVDALATRLEKTMLNPMAIEAADKLSGPNALKVRTFSSRMAVEAKRPPPKANALSKIVAPAFFFPLTGRWFVHVQAFGASTPHSSPHLLSMYLKTLALILHASGPSTTSLPQITSELWDLLLALRSHPTTSSDPLVLEALLFTLLTLLNAHTDTESGKRRLAESHARELVETREWTEQVFENASGQGEEGERVRMLAAGVLVRVREVVEKWQRLMVGDVDLGGGF
ncbi:MAG: telomere binding protein [Thelocarpon impressellum]|nr:MAG: telomere binding protein [Thelocarpon impressellum]